VIVQRHEPLLFRALPSFRGCVSGPLPSVFRLLALLCILVDGLHGFAQGFTVLRTGGGSPLVSSTESLPLSTNALPAVLTFEFGFGTDETVSPGAMFDSFSVTVQDAAMLNTLVLLTADASGIVWAPPTPGGVLLPPDAILRSGIPFPSLQPVLAQQTAFLVTVPLPTVFSGPVNVYFDLFDNLNPTASLGWYNRVQVPEPGTWALLVAGGVLVWLCRRRRS